MAKSILTASRLREVLRYDPSTGIFVRLISCQGANKSVGSVAGSIEKKGYRKITIDHEYHRAHRLAWLYVYGEWPKHEIDHINGDRADNRICNLRDVPKAINLQNTRVARPSNRSGLLGVASPSVGKKFYAMISLSGKNKILGSFDNANDAHQCYVEGKRRLHEGCTI